MCKMILKKVADADLVVGFKIVSTGLNVVIFGN